MRLPVAASHHGAAAGSQWHHEGSEWTTEGLLGAGEQAAGHEPAAGGTNCRLGIEEFVKLSGLVKAGTDCERAPSAGQFVWYQSSCISVHFLAFISERWLVIAISEDYIANRSPCGVVIFSSQLPDNERDTLAQGQVGQRTAWAGVCRRTMKEQQSQHGRSRLAETMTGLLDIKRTVLEPSAVPWQRWRARCQACLQNTSCVVFAQSNMWQQTRRAYFRISQ